MCLESISRLIFFRDWHKVHVVVINEVIAAVDSGLLSLIQRCFLLYPTCVQVDSLLLIGSG